MGLGNNPPSAGAFCLNSYYELEPIEKVISSDAVQYPGRWDSIDTYLSGISSGSTEQWLPYSEQNPQNISCHFFVCNGPGGADGQIKTTKLWQRQWSVIPRGKNQTDAPSLKEKTIRICIIADGKTAKPTNYQIKRLDALIEALCLRFDIIPESVDYPTDWW